MSKADEAADEITRGWVSSDCTEAGRRLFRQGAKLGYEKAEKECQPVASSAAESPNEKLWYANWQAANKELDEYRAKARRYEATLEAALQKIREPDADDSESVLFEVAEIIKRARSVVAPTDDKAPLGVIEQASIQNQLRNAIKQTHADAEIYGEYLKIQKERDRLKGESEGYKQNWLAAEGQASAYREALEKIAKQDPTKWLSPAIGLESSIVTAKEALIQYASSGEKK